MYLPTYSPKLNLEEQPWAAAKSQIKPHRFLQKDTLPRRIAEAYRSIEKSIFKGFVSHSFKC